MADWWQNVSSPPMKPRSNDHTIFKLTDLKSGKITDYGERNCFMVVMTTLDDYKWEISQKQESDSLKPDDYFNWIQLCKDNYIMPANALPEILHDGRLSLTLQGHYHQLFAGLNCFRWAANQKDMPKLVMSLLDARPCINFFQAFHYALKKYNYWYNHSFSDCISPSSIYDGKNCVYMIVSLGMKWFFRECERNPESAFRLKFHNIMFVGTAAAINRYIEQLGFERNNNGVESWDRDSKNIRHLPLQKPEDILWDEWTTLYDMENPTKEKILNHYDEVLGKRS